MIAPHDERSFPPMRGGRPPNTDAVDTDRETRVDTCGKSIDALLREQARDPYALNLLKQQYLAALLKEGANNEEMGALTHLVRDCCRKDPKLKDADVWTQVCRDAAGQIVNARVNGETIDWIEAVRRLEVLHPRVP